MLELVLWLQKRFHTNLGTRLAKGISRVQTGRVARLWARQGHHLAVAISPINSWAGEGQRTGEEVVKIPLQNRKPFY